MPTPLRVATSAHMAAMAPQVEAADRTRIGEIMTHGAVTVRADLGLEQLVDLFLEQGLSRVCLS